MKNTIDLIKLLVENNEIIRSLTFYEYPFYDAIQNRIEFSNFQSLHEALDNALLLRTKHRIPFWDSFNLNLFDKEISNFEFLKEINFHNIPTSERLIYKEDIIDGNLEFLNYTTVSSKINNDNSNLHLIFLDFHIPPSASNQKLCIEILKHCGLSGHLLDSGKSYHFIGNSVIEHSKLLNLLYNLLLFAPIVDKSWIAHQLIQGFCCLRVSKKYERLPVVVANF